MVKPAVALLVAFACTAAFAGTSLCDGQQQPVDLVVTLGVAPDPVVAGGLLTSTVVIQNAGTTAAVDAEMLDELPEGTTYDSITWPPGDGNWVCTVPSVGSHGKVSCTNKCFAPGDSVAFTITTAVEPCVGSLELPTTASVSSTSDESAPANNTVAVLTSVIDPGTCDDGNICTDDDRCAPAPGFNESFDLVEVPDIPLGWTSRVAGPPGVAAWRTTDIYFDTAPNSAFVPDAPDSRDAVLDSPGLPILSPTAQLHFRNRYDLEKNFDGGVLEIRLGGGPFADILDAGGSFVTGEYNDVIDPSSGSAIAGRRAWTGTNTQFVLTTVNLPAAAAGTTIVLRWRMATDPTLGRVGQWIDSVAVTGRDRCRSGSPVACNDDDACTADSCDESSGCGHVPISCDDGQFCTGDACDPILGCVHTNTTTPCDDFNVCTLTDLCGGGVCVGSNPVVCNDADACTADACNPATGCFATTANFDRASFSADRVDGRDLAVLARSWFSCPNNLRYNAAANLDPQQPCIDETDFHLFMNAFGHSCAH